MNKTANAMENGEYDFDGTVDKKVNNTLDTGVWNKWNIVKDI